MKLTRLLLAVSVILFSAHAAHADLVPDELIIEAFVDGGSVFHLRADGVFWEQINPTSAKPGKWRNRDEPTTINGVAWMPHWNKSKQERGKDKTELSRDFTLGTIDVEFQLLAVTKERGGTGIEQRDEVTTKRDTNDFQVTINDGQADGRWYKFVLRKRKK